jgi:hypothetical protein
MNYSLISLNYSLHFRRTRESKPVKRLFWRYSEMGDPNEETPSLHNTGVWGSPSAAITDHRFRQRPLHTGSIIPEAISSPDGPTL